MRYEMLDKPDFGVVRVGFEQPGEQMIVESSAMVARDQGIDMKTEMKGGLLAAARLRHLCGHRQNAVGVGDHVGFQRLQMLRNFRHVAIGPLQPVNQAAHRIGGGFLV